MTLAPDPEFSLCPDGVERHQRFPSASVLHLKGYGYYYLKRATGHWVPSTQPYAAALNERHTMPSHSVTGAP
jgi:hypothetical protein